MLTNKATKQGQGHCDPDMVMAVSRSKHQNLDTYMGHWLIFFLIVSMQTLSDDNVREYIREGPLVELREKKSRYKGFWCATCAAVLIFFLPRQLFSY